MKTQDCAERASSDPLNKVQNLLGALGLLGAGMLLHQLPPRLPGDGFKTILPSDWKVWARVLLGIGAIHKINQTFNWNPPPWLGALEAVGLMNPLSLGFSQVALKQTAVMAPVVAAVVQGAAWLRQAIVKPSDTPCQTTSLLIQLGTTLALGLVAVLAYPIVYRRLAATGIIGQDLKEKAAQEASTLASATFATCMRGCSPGSFICLTELSDVIGSFATGLSSKSGRSSSDGADSSPANPAMADSPFENRHFVAAGCS